MIKINILQYGDHNFYNINQQTIIDINPNKTDIVDFLSTHLISDRIYDFYVFGRNQVCSMNELVNLINQHPHCFVKIYDIGCDIGCDVPIIGYDKQFSWSSSGIHHKINQTNIRNRNMWCSLLLIDYPDIHNNIHNVSDELFWDKIESLYLISVFNFRFNEIGEEINFSIFNLGNLND